MHEVMYSTLYICTWYSTLYSTSNRLFTVQYCAGTSIVHGPFPTSKQSAKNPTDNLWVWFDKNCLRYLLDWFRTCLNKQVLVNSIDSDTSKNSGLTTVY